MKKAAFITILLLAGLLRCVDLSGVPAGLHLDEASIAFVAWLSAETGRDEAGGGIFSYPKSTWNPKHPVYFYASMLSTRLLGLNERAARLPSVLFGLLTVIAAFLLAKEFFKDEAAPYIAMFLVAVSPWHVHFSRVAIEAPSLPAVFSFGLLCLMKGMRRPALIIPGAALMGLCFYCYPISLVFVPLFLAGFVVVHRREAARLKGYVAAAVVIVCLFIAPFAAGASRSTGMSDYFSSTSIVSGPYRQDAEKYLAAKTDFAHRFIASKPSLVTAYSFATNYIGYLSPKFLFFKGDTSSLVHATGRFGQMYLVELPFFLLGLFFLLRLRDRNACTLLLWLALFPVGASLMTWGVSHAIRSLIALPCVELIAAAGVAGAARAAGRGAPSRFAAAAALCLLAAGINSAVYFRYYFTDYLPESSIYFNYGFKDAFKYIEENRSEARSVIVSDNIPHVYSYVFFYNPPAAEQVKRGRGGRLDVAATARALGFELCDIRYCAEKAEKPALALARPGVIPDGAFQKRASSGWFDVSTAKTVFSGAGKPLLKIGFVRDAVIKRR